MVFTTCPVSWMPAQVPVWRRQIWAAASLGGWARSVSSTDAATGEQRVLTAALLYPLCCLQAQLRRLQVLITCFEVLQRATAHLWDSCTSQSCTKKPAFLQHHMKGKSRTKKWAPVTQSSVRRLSNPSAPTEPLVALVPRPPLFPSILFIYRPENLLAQFGVWGWGFRTAFLIWRAHKGYEQRTHNLETCETTGLFMVIDTDHCGGEGGSCRVGMFRCPRFPTFFTRSQPPNHVWDAGLAKPTQSTK